MNWTAIIAALRADFGSGNAIARKAGMSTRTVSQFASDSAFDPRWSTALRLLALYARYHPEQLQEDLEDEFRRR